MYQATWDAIVLGVLLAGVIYGYFRPFPRTLHILLTGHDPEDEAEEK